MLEIKEIAGCANNVKNPIKLIEVYNITTNRSVVQLSANFEAEKDVPGPLQVINHYDNRDRNV